MIQRFDLFNDAYQMIRRDHGDYVLYADHLTELTTLMAQLKDKGNQGVVAELPKSSPSETIALIERLRGPWPQNHGEPDIEQVCAAMDEAASELTTLLERCEKAEVEAEAYRKYAAEKSNQYVLAIGDIRDIGIRLDLAERQRDEALKALEWIAKRGDPDQINTTIGAFRGMGQSAYFLEMARDCIACACAALGGAK